MLRRRYSGSAIPVINEVVMSSYTFPKDSPRLGPTGILNLADNNSTASQTNYHEIRVLSIITDLSWFKTWELKGNRGTDRHAWYRNFITSINVTAKNLKNYATAAEIRTIANRSSVKKYFDNEPPSSDYRIRIDDCYQGGAQTFVCLFEPDTTKYAVGGILVSSILLDGKEYPVRLDDSYVG